MSAIQFKRFFLDPDFRRTPATDQYCAVCQRDIKDISRADKIYIDSCGIHAIHPDCAGDHDVALVGPDCSKTIPDEFKIKS